MHWLRGFLRDESGTTAIEYALIVACISVAILVVVQEVGARLNSSFGKVDAALVHPRPR